jgi:hypothetical protein
MPGSQGLVQMQQGQVRIQSKVRDSRSTSLATSIIEPGDPEGGETGQVLKRAGGDAAHADGRETFYLTGNAGLLGAPATGSAGFPAGTSLARLNAVPKTWEIAKTLEPELNPSELNIREGRCKIASAARSPDAGIEPASGEAGWKAGAPSWPAGKPALPVAGWKAGAPSGRLESRRSQLAGWKAGAPSWPAGKPALPVGGAPSWPAGKPALPVGGAPSGRRRLRRGDDLNPAHLARSLAAFRGMWRALG